MPPWAPGADNAPPRLRGEHPEAKTRRHTAHGSSPLTRGAPRRPRLLHHVPGLIPAYAGSTPIAGNGIGGCWAHPRLRGEHTGMKTPRGRAVGSSPLTRGALIGVRARTPQTAHPRLRGEHIFSLQLGLALLGSSPLTRGARFVFGGFVIRHRLIPAYAGSTVEFPLFRCLPGAHPRLRGEHGLAPVYTGNTLGSSPLTRGAPARKVPPARAHGLIPAYAGSTTTARIYAAGLGAHPRLRGEHRGTTRAGVAD